MKTIELRLFYVQHMQKASVFPPSLLSKILAFLTQAPTATISSFHDRGLSYEFLYADMLKAYTWIGATRSDQSLDTIRNE